MLNWNGFELKRKKTNRGNKKIPVGRRFLALMTCDIIVSTRHIEQTKSTWQLLLLFMFFGCNREKKAHNFAFKRYLPIYSEFHLYTFSFRSHFIICAARRWYAESVAMAAAEPAHTRQETTKKKKNNEIFQQTFIIYMCRIETESRLVV